MRTIRVATVLSLCWSVALAAPVPKDRKEPPHYPTLVGTKLVYDYQEVGELVFVVTEVKDIKGGKRVTVERRDLKEPIIDVVEVTESGLVQVEHSGELKFPTNGRQRECGVNSDREVHRWLVSARPTRRSSNSRP